MNLGVRRSLVGVLGAVSLAAQPAVELPEMSVSAPRVANEAPAATFAMPVSALRFEPLADVQARNLAEGQADVALRGGTFEQTGFRLGALPLYDPQTGHYFAEIPLAPGMLSVPAILTGDEGALRAWNAGSGSVAYRFARIREGGMLAAGIGEGSTRRAEVSMAHRRPGAADGAEWAAEAALAASRSDGLIAHGDHDFRRAALRLQRAGRGSQTDLLAGYQEKFFGWPNLYTPFNSPESENLQTVLLALHHRREAGPGDWLEAGVYHRRHKDDYAFNRFAPLGPVHPFQHTTWVWGAGVDARRTAGELAWDFSAAVVTDELRSTSLTFGRYSSRTHAKAAVAPERTWALADGRRLRLRAGAALDDTNRDGAAFSPLAGVVLEPRRAGGVRLHASFARSSQVATYTALNAAPGAGLFRGNPNLGRQTADTLEAGAAWAAAGWTLGATAFLRRDDDLVDWTFRRGVTARTANAVDLETVGLEAVARYSSPRWDIIAGYTALAKDADYGTSPVDASFYALNFPKHRLTLAVTARLGRGWEVRIDNEFRVQEDNPLRRRGGDEAVISAVGILYTPPRLSRVTLLAQVENAWDSAFEEVPAVPATPRHVVAGFQYRF